MATSPAINGVSDFGSFAKLRADARAQDPKALREAARQFEAMFTQMLLKASHSEDSGGDLLGGAEADTYRGLFDQQMAQQLTSGHGLGIADLLVRQLQGVSHAAPAAAAAPHPAASGVGPATVAPAASGPVPASSDSFVEVLQPHAEKAASELGIPSRVLVAQAALETGWGQHAITKADGAPSHNYFGIKADKSWTGPTVTKSTTEYVAGVPHTETASFRAYGSPAEGFADYVKFVKGNPRYAEALRHGGNAGHYLEGLQKAGYASDPAYAAKITRIAYGRAMQTALVDSSARIA